MMIVRCLFLAVALAEVSSTSTTSASRWSLSSASHVVVPSGRWSRRPDNHRRRQRCPNLWGVRTPDSGINFARLAAPSRQRAEAARRALVLTSTSGAAAGTAMTAMTATPAIGYTLLRGALLRIASDLSGGTVLECIKTRTTLSKENMVQATRNIVREGGFWALWTGTPSRTVEGALIGAVFMLGSVLTRDRIKTLGGPPTVAALAGGLVGGVAQSLIMTPAGMIFTSLNYNKDRPGHEHDNAITVTRRIIHEKGLAGLYYGNGPMALRQASNWASRAGFTEITRSVLGLSKFGLTGELLSGCIGGVLSTWNTPIETIRVVMQRDVSVGIPPKTMRQYWDDIKAREGFPGLFRGGVPRAIQAVWQTTFLVVVPNLMGI